MTKIILDIETTVTWNEDGKSSPSPYLPSNKLVSVGLKNTETGYSEYLYFNHNELTTNPYQIKFSTERLQSWLSQSSLIIGHNLKFDMSWLYECGFKYDGPLYDTMIFEYVAAKGRKPQLSLSACAARYGLEPKKDILSDYLSRKVNTDEIPLKELEEYGLQDIETTFQLYQHQRKRYKEEQEIKTMWPVMKLSMETLEVLIDIERAGIKIDTTELERVEKEFRDEKTRLEQDLYDMARDVMGDTPLNFASSADMSMVVYGRKVKDKKVWAELFNIGTEQRGAVKKVKYNTRYSDSEFKKVIRENTEVVYRTSATHCTVCDGKGSIQKYKKDKVEKKTGEVVKGEPYKNPTKCTACDGKGVVYMPSTRRAGFNVRPLSSEYATINGFSTDKLTIDDLIASGSLSEEAELFLKKLQRVNALDTYLTSFVDGIRKGVRENALCHPNFNQCVTATGRLSSSGPNFQNFPRGNTFPIRKVFISRWEGGKLMPTDFAALEYRTAVMLAKCPAGLKSILEGKDRHALSAAVIYGAVKENMEPEEWKQVRQKAKSSTFQPLYGGAGATEASKAYAEAFFQEHTGISRWHEELVKEALTYKQITTPSGRIFSFPDIKRNEHGRVQGKTQLVNYPVQSFASAEIAWSVIIPMWREMKARGLKSKLVLQVHDDVVPDVHPDEVDVMFEIIKKHFNNVWGYLTDRFKYDTNVPIGYEISIGDNLMDKKTLYEGSGIDAA